MSKHAMASTTPSLSLLTHLCAGNFLWAGIVSAATQHHSTRAAAADVESFFAPGSGHPAGSAERKVRQALETIRSAVWRAAILRRDSPRSLVETASAFVATAE